MAKKGFFQRIKEALFGKPKPAPKPAPRPAPAAPTPSLSTLYQRQQQHIWEVEERAAAFAALPKCQRVGANRPEDEETLFWRIYDGLVD